MKIGLIFGFGVLAFNLAAALISCFLYGRSIGSILAIVPGITMWSLVAWIFFSVGATVFKKSSSLMTPFVLGVLCALVQLVVGKVATPYIASVNEMFAFFVLPVAIFSFFAPAVSRRNG